MKEIKLTRGFSAQVDDEEYTRLSLLPWKVEIHNDKAYAVLSHNGPRTTMHSLVIGNPPCGMVIDHKDTNGLNNQKENLRFCTHSQNKMNRDKTRANTSGYKGVRRHRFLWQAYIVVNGKQKTIGSFKDKTSAAAAYNEAALKYFGEFAKLNPICKELKPEQLMSFYTSSISSASTTH